MRLLAPSFALLFPNPVRNGSECGITCIIRAYRRRERAFDHRLCWAFQTRVGIFDDSEIKMKVLSPSARLTAQRRPKALATRDLTHMYDALTGPWCILDCRLKRGRRRLGVL